MDRRRHMGYFAALAFPGYGDLVRNFDTWTSWLRNGGAAEKDSSGFARLSIALTPLPEEEQMIAKESYSIDTSDPDFIHIHHVQIRGSGVDMGGSTWFERKNLGWVVDTLQACLTTYAFPETTTQSGQDSLKVYESGPEQEPVINLRNRRPQDAPHGGLSGFVMSKPSTEKLVKELAALR